MQPEISPVGRHIVAVLRKEVVTDLQEQRQRDTSTWNIDAVIRLAEQGIKWNKGKMMTQQFVCESIHFKKSLEFL